MCATSSSQLIQAQRVSTAPLSKLIRRRSWSAHITSSAVISMPSTSIRSCRPVIWRLFRAAGPHGTFGRRRGIAPSSEKALDLSCMDGLPHTMPRLAPANGSTPVNGAMPHVSRARLSIGAGVTVLYLIDFDRQGLGRRTNISRPLHGLEAPARSARLPPRLPRDRRTPCRTSARPRRCGISRP
jgi:hypothetical protein